MKCIEKTVFISYRRANESWALAIYQNLRDDYDVFIDFANIASGDFEQIIIQNIKARAHFIIILTPSALERCDDPNDWLRREIECAIENKRNIIPIMLEGFEFGSPTIARYLIGKLVMLKKYNGMTATVEYFDAAMARLREQFLSVSLDAVLHPVSDIVESSVRTQKDAANAAPPVTEQSLIAQQWFEKGNLSDDSNEKIRCYNQAIKLQPDFVEAYNNRGNAYAKLKYWQVALVDHNRAIELRPGDALPYINRGVTYHEMKDYPAALVDYSCAIELQPDFAEAYNNRGNTYVAMEDYPAALTDLNRAIELNPKYANAYNNRGKTHAKMKEFPTALANLNRAIELQPDYAAPYNNRGLIFAVMKEYPAALADYSRAIELQPDYVDPVYNTACAYALQHQVKLACTWLKRAIEMDRKCLEDARNDTDFDPIRETLEFQALVSEFDNRT